MPSPRLPALALCVLASLASAQNNVLMLVADDLGVDRVAAYRAHPNPGNTPHLDRLATDGVLFTAAWSNPLCSPTRATWMTGRYGFRTGVGSVIFNAHDTFALPRCELTLPELLRQDAPVPYVSVALGKWHLGTEHAGGALHPWIAGFDAHFGAYAALGGTYFQWQKSFQGTIVPVQRYATTDTVEDAIVLAQQLPEPWFLYVAFHAPHSPYHAPPAHLHGYSLSGDPTQSVPLHAKAMTEAMDTEIGRLVASLGTRRARTTIVFAADNGTDGVATEPPSPARRAKGTLYEGGIRIPLIVSGAGVAAPGRRCDALVNTVDLFATVAELAGAQIPRGLVTDSVSLVPYLQDPQQDSIRSVAYAEQFHPNGPGPHPFSEHAIRDQRYKLIRRLWLQHEELYDLALDPRETTNLLGRALTADQLRAYLRLRASLSRLRG